MSLEWLTAFISFLALVVTIMGWDVTHTKQKELANIQAEIQKKISEHDIRFSYLYKKRFKVVDKLYKQIDQIISLLQQSMRQGRIVGERTPEEQRSEAMSLIGPLIKYYYQNRLYLEPNLCEKMEKLFEHLQEFMLDIGSANLLMPLRIGFPEYTDKQYREYMDKAKDVVLKDLSPIQEIIEMQMRKILY